MGGSAWDAASRGPEHAFPDSPWAARPRAADRPGDGILADTRDQRVHERQRHHAGRRRRRILRLDRAVQPRIGAVRPDGLLSLRRPRRSAPLAFSRQQRPGRRLPGGVGVRQGRPGTRGRAAHELRHRRGRRGPAADRRGRRRRAGPGARGRAGDGHLPWPRPGRRQYLAGLRRGHARRHERRGAAVPRGPHVLRGARLLQRRRAARARGG